MAPEETFPPYLEDMRRTPLSLVREFHVTYGLPVTSSPGDPGQAQAMLRDDLIEEEYDEVMGELLPFWSGNHSSPSLVRLAKELADLVYVLYGTALTFGIDLDAVLAEVHRSNMSKLGPNGEVFRREDGKILKGPNYTEADVKGVLGLGHD